MEKFPEAARLLEGEVNLSYVQPLERSAIERVHHRSYLDAVSWDLEGKHAGSCGLTRYERNRLGLPANPYLLERSILETSGTVRAAFAALEDGMAANLAGGTHHAFPDRGQGYCVLNDIAVAVSCLRAVGRQLHCLIVDTDAHQGIGNHFWFREDAMVYTYSIHVGRNYPAKKEPGDCDVPLERNVEGSVYLKEFEATLPVVFEKTEPDLVFWISGADNHYNDRFGQMRLTTDEMAIRDRYVLQCCEQFAAPVVVVYGGGYNRMPGKTAALHAQSIRLARDSFTKRGLGS